MSYKNRNLVPVIAPSISMSLKPIPDNTHKIDASSINSHGFIFHKNPNDIIILSDDEDCNGKSDNIQNIEINSESTKKKIYSLKDIENKEIKIKTTIKRPQKIIDIFNSIEKSEEFMNNSLKPLASVNIQSNLLQKLDLSVNPSNYHPTEFKLINSCNRQLSENEQLSPLSTNLKQLNLNIERIIRLPKLNIPKPPIQLISEKSQYFSERTVILQTFVENQKNNILVKNNNLGDHNLYTKSIYKYKIPYTTPLQSLLNKNIIKPKEIGSPKELEFSKNINRNLLFLSSNIIPLQTNKEKTIEIIDQNSNLQLINYKIIQNKSKNNDPEKYCNIIEKKIEIIDLTE